MSLLDYLKSLSKGERETFSKACDTSVDYLFQVAYGQRKPKAALAVSIERFSEGRIRCEALLPDVDWAYIRASGCPAEGAAA